MYVTNFPFLYYVIVTYVMMYFLHAKAGTAVACLSHGNSVRPFIRPSHRWISQKRCKL